MDWAHKRLGAAAAIFDANGDVLLVRHASGALNWELPGGASERGESTVETRRIEDAARGERPQTVVEIPPRTWLS